jgi:hypothetical protein
VVVETLRRALQAWQIFAETLAGERGAVLLTKTVIKLRPVSMPPPGPLPATSW